VSHFNGKVAIVTGAGRGIGRATAQLLAASGAQVVVAEITAEAGESVVNEITTAGGQALYIHTDVGNADAIRACVDQTVAHYGRLDYVVNNAYWSARGSVEEIEEADWDRSMAVMLKAIYLFGKYAFPAMRAAGGGAMVNIASVHGLAAYRQYAVYAAAKAGVINLTKAMALDAGKDHIRVNAVCPGWVITAASPPSEAALRTTRAIYAVGRPGVPDDIAKVVRFLLSDDAGFVTGQAIVADGGLTAQLPDASAYMATKAALDALADEPAEPH
jgi:meso-butanediol dehydrogenase / (S,S)-butanediol dehydrogenase / diacetyl reductase